MNLKDELLLLLRGSRSVMLTKLEGLSEYDRRRPLTPSGTNLLGLVKHLAGLEYGYLGASFGRPPVERSCLVRQPCAVWADFQHRGASVSHPAPNDGRHAPPRNERVPLDSPTLCKSAQDVRQLVKPWRDLGSKPRGETPPNSIVDPRPGRTHRADGSAAAIGNFAIPARHRSCTSELCPERTSNLARA